MIDGGVQAAVMVKDPEPSAKSLAPVWALTVKLVVPPGVAGVVEIVKVDVCEDAAAAKETGFGEKDAFAPVGKDVMTLRVAVNAPDEPVPVPRLTVIV